MKLFILFFSLLLFLNSELNAKANKELLTGVVLERINRFITYSEESIGEKFKICVHRPIIDPSRIGCFLL